MIRWPTYSTITCRDIEGDIIAKSTRGKLDLSDSLMGFYNARVCTIAVSTKSKNWGTWTIGNVKKIEEHIRYDLGFDGYKVEIKRLSKPSRKSCTQEFNWELEIESDFGEDDSMTKYPVTKIQIPTRFKVARSDATVKSIQLKIENVFGLPRGCVSLLDPTMKRVKSNSSIKTLRIKWK